MALSSEQTPAPAPSRTDLRTRAQRIREIGESAAAHAGNAAALLRLAAAQREQAAGRR